MPNCPPTTGLSINCIRGCSLELKLNENFLFSFQNKTCGDSWVSKTDANDTKPAAKRTLGLPHTWLPESEKERGDGRSQGTYLRGAETREGKLTPHMRMQFQESKSPCPEWAVTSCTVPTPTSKSGAF